MFSNAFSNFVFHELSYVIVSFIGPNNFRAANSIQIALRGLFLLQTAGFGYFFFRMSHDRTGFTRSFLGFFIILSGLNSALLWLCCAWIGFLDNRSLQQAVTERTPLMPFGELPAAGFLAYWYRGTFLYMRIAVPVSLITLVLLCTLQGPPPDFFVLVSAMIVLGLGILDFWAWQFHPAHYYLIPLCFVIQLLITAYFAWLCTKAGYIPHRYKRILQRFTIVNSLLMLIIIIETIIIS